MVIIHLEEIVQSFENQHRATYQFHQMQRMRGFNSLSICSGKLVYI